jgi:hypothetical protein
MIAYHRRVAEPVVHEDPEGERALERDITLLRRRRMIGWISLFVALGAMTAFVLWPPSPCELLAQKVCQSGQLHCSRSREVIKGSLERQECEALLVRPSERAELLIDRFPETAYTEAEQQQMLKNPKLLP